MCKNPFKWCQYGIYRLHSVYFTWKEHTSTGIRSNTSCLHPAMSYYKWTFGPSVAMQTNKLEAAQIDVKRRKLNIICRKNEFGEMRNKGRQRDWTREAICVCVLDDGDTATRWRHGDEMTTRQRDGDTVMRWRQGDETICVNWSDRRATDWTTIGTTQAETFAQPRLHTERWNVTLNVIENQIKQSNNYQSGTKG